MKSDKSIYLSKPGLISCLGDTLEENMQKILQGKSALEKDEQILKKPIYIGKINSPLPKIKNPLFQTRTNQILLNSILQIDDIIQKAIKKYGKNRIGVVIGTTTTGIEENFELFKNNAKTSKWNLSLYEHEKQALSNPADFVKDFYSLSGISYGISTACTSGAKALINARRLIENDICDCVICGGVDSINTLTINGFDSLGLLCPNISNPLSKNRNGINIGEGAGVFLCSRDEISSVILAGYASNSDAFHITQPDEKAIKPIQAIQEALQKASLSEVDYINLHSTGTKANDKMESYAFSKTLPQTVASSTKPLMGHTLGAAGAIEAGICHALISKQKTSLPPHMYDGAYDENLEKIQLVKKDEIREINSALSSSFAFGGDNAILVLKNANV